MEISYGKAEFLLIQEYLLKLFQREVAAIERRSWECKSQLIDSCLFLSSLVVESYLNGLIQILW